MKITNIYYLLISCLLDCLRPAAELSPCENMWDSLYITDCKKVLWMLGKNEDAEGAYNVSAGGPALLKDFVCWARAVVNPVAELRLGAETADPERTFWLEPDVNRLMKLDSAVRRDSRKE